LKTLLILRHGKSSRAHTDIPDHDRPLKKRGKRDARRMGQLLLDQELVPDLILTSTAKRARKTARLTADTCGYSRGIAQRSDLYMGGPTAYIEALQGVADESQRVMVVGHNPDLELLLEVLTGHTEWLPTAALAYISLPILSWTDVREYIEGDLVELWTPKGLKQQSR
jgi:phosphohistidine phosphatase